MLVIDTNSDTTASISELQQRRVTAVGRYYSSRNAKNISKTEATALSNAGMQIFCVFEDSGSPSLNVQSGLSDAGTALSRANAIGQTRGSAIYFALEHLPDGYKIGDIVAIKQYVGGIKTAFAGAFKIGIYSDGVVCQSLLDAGLCDFAWLSASSSFEGSKDFYRSRRWCLAQSSHIDQNWAGLSVDTNEVNGDFGGFSLTDPNRGGAVVAAAAVSVPATVTIVAGQRYQATIVLQGLERLATNDLIASKFRDFGFADVTVTGSGPERQATGVWGRSTETVTPDDHFKDIKPA